MKRISVIVLVSAAVLGALALGVLVVIPNAAETSEAGGGQARAETAEAAPEADPTPVRVVEARLGPVAVHLSTTSAVEAERTAKILSETSGVLTEVRVREGDSVARNEVLARVDARERRLSFQQAELRLARAEAELSRQERAFEQELVSEYDYEKARFDRDLSASELSSAQLALERTDIHAPFAGRITELLLVAGGHLDPGQHLLTLADFDTLITRLYVPERDVRGLSPGQSALVRPESEVSGAGFAGTIREVSPIVDRSTGTVKVTVALSQAAGAVVRPGSFARVSIETGRRENAVLAPKRGVLQGEAGAHVFVVEDGKAVLREVTLGAEMETPEGALLEFSQGLEAGAQVVVAGQTTLADGAPVEVLTPTANPAAAAGKPAGRNPAGTGAASPN